MSSTRSCAPRPRPLTNYSSRSTLDAFQRLFYAAREKANVAEAPAVRFVATMNGDTLRQLGREVTMGGVVALLGLPAACEEAAATADGPTGIVLWDVELVLNSSLDDSEIQVTTAAPVDGSPAT